MQYLIWIKKINLAFTGGDLWILIQKNKLFLFDSFGIEGLKLFIVDNDQDIVNELLYNFKKCESISNQKLELRTMKFCVETWEKMSHKKNIS